jgi:hypothetical protein
MVIVLNLQAEFVTTQRTIQTYGLAYKAVSSSMAVSNSVFDILFHQQPTPNNEPFEQCSVLTNHPIAVSTRGLDIKATSGSI